MRQPIAHGDDGLGLHVQAGVKGQFTADAAHG
jgi:hypothetical protein